MNRGNERIAVLRDLDLSITWTDGESRFLKLEKNNIKTNAYFRLFLYIKADLCASLLRIILILLCLMKKSAILDVCHVNN